MPDQLLTPPGFNAEQGLPPEAPVDFGGSFLVRNLSESPFLPPARYRRPIRERIPTPTDERGLIDIPALLEAVKATIDPEYQWPTDPSDHHFYWPEAAYPHDHEGLVNPAWFRNLPIHKGRIPRVFENWLHEVTLPAPVPSTEVMHYRVESWRVAVHLFRSASKVVEWEQLAARRAEYADRNAESIGYDKEGNNIGEQVMAGIIGRYFKGLDMHLERLGQVPPEFRLVEPNVSPQEIATRLGSLVLPRAMPLTNVILQPAA